MMQILGLFFRCASFMWALVMEGLLEAMEVSARKSTEVGGDGPEAVGDWRNCFSNWAVVLQLLPAHK